MDEYVRYMIVFLECIYDGHKVQTLEAAHLDDIVLQAPVLCLQRDNVVDIFEQTRDCVCLRTVRLRHAPEYVGNRQAIPLYR
jgi:hypothetical protein